MRSKLSCSRTPTGVGAVTLGLLGVWLLSHHPANGQQAAAVPIPELRRWDENMTDYGVRHGNERAYSISAGYQSEAHAWYYDGPRVFYQIADYTGDSKWNWSAERCLESYRAYVFVLKGKVPGWRVFPHGLCLHFKRTGDEQSKEAAIFLSRNSPYAASGGRPGEEHSRETAYCINAYLVAEALGEPRHPKLEQAVEYALGHIDQWFVQNASKNWAPFMFGLTCEALIYYHDKVRKDPGILPAIKIGLDECWKRAWIDEKQAFFYRADNPKEAAPTLNLLVAPAFAWVYLQTGDTTYRDRGDKVFAGGVRGAYLDGGKQFSQNYRWSFDYVKWRTEAAGGPAGLTSPSLPSPTKGGLGTGVAMPPVAPGVQEQSPRLPEGTGLAAKYPGDAGIERDSAVVFAENFELGSLEEIGRRWGNISNKDGKVLAFSDDVPSASGGKRSLVMTGTLGENSGGHLYTRFRGEDKAFLRFYTKFAADHAYEHHFVELGGYHPPTPWPNPRAGTRPAGDERVLVFVDAIGWYGRYAPPGIWGLYTYWPEMKKSADGNYWGNVLSPAQPVPIPLDRWLCVELLVKLNSAPESYDGELALWVDGKLVMRFAKGMQRGPWSGMGFDLVESNGVLFEGLRLRTSLDLKINHLWLEHYVDEGAQHQNKLANPNRVNRVWFDDIVVARSYIGPIQKR